MTAVEKYQKTKNKIDELHKLLAVAINEHQHARKELMMEMNGSPVKISMREKQVLDMVRQHLLNKEIADKLNISERTVKFHVKNLLMKHKVDKRVLL